MGFKANPPPRRYVRPPANPAVGAGPDEEDEFQGEPWQNGKNRLPNGFWKGDGKQTA